MSSLRPLAGQRVLDLSRYAPGPYCSLLLAALGAEVIKIEAPPDGDPLRRLDPAAFERLNAGKKSLVLDLKTEEARDSFLDLARESDVLIEGFRPGVMDRLGLGYDAVARQSEGIIYLSLTGYGQSGPYRERAGHDIDYMALAGALSRAHEPLPLQVADFAAGGLYGVVAVLASLLERRRTGKGAHLDLSMHHGLLSLMMLAIGPAADALSGRYPGYTLYQTSDGGRIAVGALEPKFWIDFCDALERPDLAERATDAGARDEVARIIRSRTRDEWASLFAERESCAEPVLTIEESREHPQAIARGADAPGFRWPFGLDPELGPAPKLGEHNDQLLATGN